MMDVPHKDTFTHKVKVYLLKSEGFKASLWSRERKEKQLME